MARRGFIESLLRIAITESLKNAKRSSSQRGKTQDFAPRRIQKSEDLYKTRYQIPTDTLKLASRGMHAYPVSGESFYLENFEKLGKIYPGQEEVFTRGFLVPEPKNPWDRNAVAVVIAGLVVGHIPRHTAAEFSKFLSGKVGECGARIYFNSFSGRHSIELDCDFPPRLADDPVVSFDSILGNNNEPVYTMGQITSRGSEINLVSWGRPAARVSKKSPYFGVAILREGFRDAPEVIDASTLQIIGHPYETISYDFNLFARSWGGEVKVRYKLEVKDNGRPKVWLDSSALPKFKTSKY
jgi:hypothetical protein